MSVGVMKSKDLISAIAKGVGNPVFLVGSSTGRDGIHGATFASEELTDETCRWPIGHPFEEKFYFCGRTAIDKFPYCKLHLIYAYQPKNAKEEDIVTEEDIPKFIEKKIKSA